MRIAAGSYTNSKKVDQAVYRERNREKIRARKKEWMALRKPCPNCGKIQLECMGNCIFNDLPNKGF